MKIEDKNKKEFGLPSLAINFSNYKEVRDALNLYFMEHNLSSKDNIFEIEFCDNSKTTLEIYNDYYEITCNCKKSNNKTFCKHELFTISKICHEPLPVSFREKKDSGYSRLTNLYLIIDSTHGEDFMYRAEENGYTSDFTEAGIYDRETAKNFPIIYSIKELKNYSACAISLLDFIKEMVDLNMIYITENRFLNERKEIRNWLKNM